uniref:Uncharacterized protein n=1 Tax=Romanomermis culicivorax TaxID=13658 RepID=A0A915JCB5_ROMCU
MSWSSQIHEQFKEIQIQESSPKPMGGFGRGRLVANSCESPSTSLTQNGASNAKSPRSFSFKLNPNENKAADSPAPQPQIIKSIFGGGSNTSNAFSSDSTPCATFGSVSSTFGSSFGNSTADPTFSVENATATTTFGTLADTDSTHPISSVCQEKIVGDAFDMEDEKRKTLKLEGFDPEV